MTEKDSLHGLSCPNCGGMVPIPEGQAIVHCPFCEQRSFVRGERGLRRYQVAQRVDRDKAFAGLRQFPDRTSCHRQRRSQESRTH